jgi:hypothetical protein
MTREVGGEPADPTSFDIDPAPVARGYFLGDYEGLTSRVDVHAVFAQAATQRPARRSRCAGHAHGGRGRGRLFPVRQPDGGAGGWWRSTEPTCPGLLPHSGQASTPTDEELAEIIRSVDLQA